MSPASMLNLGARFYKSVNSLLCTRNLTIIRSVENRHLLIIILPIYVNSKPIAKKVNDVCVYML